MSTSDQNREAYPLDTEDAKAHNQARQRVMANAEDVLRLLDKKPPLTRPDPSQPNRATKVPECEPFDLRSGPSAVIPFRQAVQLLEIAVFLGDPIEGQPSLNLACVEIAALKVSLALDLLFDQVWEFQHTMIADLQSTLPLAPREEVRLEFRNTQRKVLQQTVIDSVEELNSSESTIADKDIVNVARSSSLTKNWRVDGNGSFSLGGSFSIGVSGGTSTTVNSAASSSIQQIHESTKRSAQSLKTLHKVEVRGTSESLIEEKVLRIIKNPYYDRTLTLNIFQLLKHYLVTTSLADSRPALIIEIKSLVMDRTFILANGGFLKSHLLDTDLAEELIGALANARRPPRSQNRDAAKQIAIEALRYLFDEPNIFNVPNVASGPLTEVSRNDLTVSYDASIEVGDIDSGLEDSVDNHAGIIFTTLNFFYKRYRDLTPSQRDADAISMALALASDLKGRWDAMDPDEVRDVLDINDFTEPLRRLSGFIAMVNGMLQPLLEPAEHEREAEAAAERAEYVIERVVEHLSCHREYYVQRFLRYLATQTEFVAISEFIRDVLSRLQIDSDVRGVFEEAFDPYKAFLDRSEIVVPSTLSFDLSEVMHTELNDIEIPSTEAEVDLPLDGFHIEIVPGRCRLPDVPVPAFEAKVGEFSIKDAVLGLSENVSNGISDNNDPQ